jgi:hypothetical protein
VVYLLLINFAIRNSCFRCINIIQVNVTGLEKVNIKAYTSVSLLFRTHVLGPHIKERTHAGGGGSLNSEGL